MGTEPTACWSLALAGGYYSVMRDPMASAGAAGPGAAPPPPPVAMIPGRPAVSSTGTDVTICTAKLPPFATITV